MFSYNVIDTNKVGTAWRKNVEHNEGSIVENNFFKPLA